MTHHLAQINIGRLIAPVDDPKIAEFVAQLDPVNALADRSRFCLAVATLVGERHGYRLQRHPFVIVNMSVSGIRRGASRFCLRLESPGCVS